MMCSPDHLQEEECYIENIFKLLYYPNYFLYSSKSKVLKINRIEKRKENYK